MALIRYKPYSLLHSVKQEMDKLFETANQDFPNDATENTVFKWRPHVDIQEKDDSYVVTADIPGVDPKDIKVSINNNTLTIQGEKVLDNRETDKTFQRIERYAGSFYRQFSLPANVAGESIKAKSKHGVLELTLPKAKDNSTKYIAIEDGS